MSTLPKKPRATKRRGRHPDKALSADFCRNVGEAGRYADGNGLYLHVDPSGTRRWVQRLVICGRSRGLGLGSHALVSLAQARRKALSPGSRSYAGAGSTRTRSLIAVEVTPAQADAIPQRGSSGRRAARLGHVRSAHGWPRRGTDRDCRPRRGSRPDRRPADRATDRGRWFRDARLSRHGRPILT